MEEYHRGQFRICCRYSCETCQEIYNVVGTLIPSCDSDPDVCWRTVSKYLKTQPVLQPGTATHILKCATHKCDWDVVRSVLEMDHLFLKEDLHPLLLSALDRDQWDIVFKVLERDFVGKKDMILEAFVITVNMRDWRRVRDMMPLLGGSSLDFEVPFIESAFAGRLLEVQRLLSEGQYDSSVLNGNLVVLAAGGICDPIAELIMTVKNAYTKETFVNSLLLSAHGYSAELIPRLLNHPEASLSVDNLLQAKKLLSRNRDDMNHERFLMLYFNSHLQKLQACQEGVMCSS